MLETKLGEAVDMMIRTDRMHMSLIDSRIKSIGIHRTQHRILMRLSRCGRLPSQKELAEHLDITAAAVTGALKKLERDGYVERTIGQDNRYNELKLTQKGKELVMLTRQRCSEVDNAIFEGFTEQELTSYTGCLNKLQENMKRLLDEANKTNESEEKI